MSDATAIENAVRPARPSKVRPINPERPHRDRPARPLSSGGKPVRDNSRATLVETDTGGAVVIHMPSGRPAVRDPAAALAHSAALLLADAQKVAPGVAVKVVHRGRVLASVAIGPSVAAASSSPAAADPAVDRAHPPKPA